MKHAAAGIGAAGVGAKMGAQSCCQSHRDDLVSLPRLAHREDLARNVLVAQRTAALDLEIFLEGEESALRKRAAVTRRRLVDPRISFELFTHPGQQQLALASRQLPDGVLDLDQCAHDPEPHHQPGRGGISLLRIQARGNAIASAFVQKHNI